MEDGNMLSDELREAVVDGVKEGLAEVERERMEGVDMGPMHLNIVKAENGFIVGHYGPGSRQYICQTLEDVVVAVKAMIEPNGEDL